MQTSELEFYRDDSGAPCARGKDDRLATFLETDLQGSEGVTLELLKLLERDKERGEFNGNGHGITVSAMMATIESNFGDRAPARRLPRAQLLATVRDWLAFIRSAD